MLPSESSQPTRRRKLWEVESRWHCAVVGTCASLPELRKLAVKAGLVIPEGTSDYALHSMFVRAAGSAGTTARLLHKMLDRKFALSLSRFAKVENAAAVHALWRHKLTEGEVAGAFWALVTHPLAGPDLLEEAHGEVHMLSHLAGASSRAGLKRQADAERRLAEAAGELAEARHRRAEDEAAITELRRRLSGTEDSQRRIERLEARLAELESGTALRAEQAARQAAELACEKAVRRAEAAEIRLAERVDEVIGLVAERDRAKHQAEELRADMAALEAGLCQASGCSQAETCSTTPDLCGQRILYVGGIDRMVPHLKSMAARCNGEFLHHDGGTQDGVARLTGVLAQADAILCPIDCVSHEAVDQIKKACRRCEKPFIPLRGAGLSSFARGLRQVAAREN